MKKTNSLINGVSVLNSGGDCMCLKQVVDVQQDGDRKTCLLEPKRPGKWGSYTRFFMRNVPSGYKPYSFFKFSFLEGSPQCFLREFGNLLFLVV